MKKILILDKKVTKNLLTLTKYLQLDSDYEYFSKSYEDVSFYCDSTFVQMFINSQDVNKYDLVYFRRVATSQFPIVYIINSYLAKNNIAMVEDRYSNIILTSNKLAQTVQMALNDIPVPKTIYMNSKMINNKTAAEIFEKIGSKIIIMKSTSSHRGINNFRISSVKEILDIAAEIETEFIFQDFIPNDSDYRLLVLGDRVEVAEVRKRVDDLSHLNNISQGADELFIPVEEISKDLQSLAVKAAKLFNLNVAGVDIVVSTATGRAYVLEVNAAPAFTYTDSSPEFAAIQSYIENIIKE